MQFDSKFIAFRRQTLFESKNFLTLSAVPATACNQQWSPSLNENRRFECIRDITDTWIIWDRLKKQPAQFSEVALVGLTHKQAGIVCDLLNARLDNRGRKDRRTG